MLAFACMMSVCLTSCGDDDPTPTPTPTPTKKATRITVNAEYYTSVNTLKYFNVTVTDAAGNITEVTSENTQAAASFPKDDAGIFNLKDDELRVYKLASETFKSFPKTVNYIITVTPKAVGPAEGEKATRLMEPYVYAENDVKAWDNYAYSVAYSTPLRVSGSKWNEYVKKYGNGYSVALTCQFNDAASLAVSKVIDYKAK